MDDRVEGPGTLASAHRVDRPLGLPDAELRAYPALRNLGTEIDQHLPMRGRVVDRHTKLARAGDRW